MGKFIGSLIVGRGRVGIDDVNNRSFACMHLR